MATFRRDPFRYLTGALDETSRPPSVSGVGEGGKFTPDGQVQRFPGNTIICHLDQRSAAFRALVEIQARLRAGPHADHFAFLPPESFHMTIFPGFNSVRPDPARGFADVGPHLSLREVSNRLLERIDAVDDWPTEFRVSARDLHGGYSVTLDGHAAHDERLLRATRSRLADACRSERPDSDSYTFHFSLAYLIDWLEPDAAREVLATSDRLFVEHRADLQDIRLGPMEFCEFDDMYAFDRLRLIVNAASDAVRTGRR